jgi:hypothetical protein
MITIILSVLISAAIIYGIEIEIKKLYEEASK